MNPPRRILVVLGHPRLDSLCSALAQSYAQGAAEAGAQVEVLRLADLSFDVRADPVETEIEPDLRRAQDMIASADHAAFVYPLWWGSCPALFKAFIDRAFLPGFAFRYREKGGMPERLLKGRTARIMMTMDSPRWFHSLVYRASGTQWLRWATLWFTGFHVLKSTVFPTVRTSTAKSRAAWLETARRRGAEDAVRKERAPRPAASATAAG